jgi:carbon-monoxide dehydrogenase small subunit
MPEKTSVSMLVNGQTRTVDVWPMERLLDVLRGPLALTGTKEGCGEGECGACAVIMDGNLVSSCLIPALAAEGASITTIEGLAMEDGLDPLQQAFIEEGGAQCGFCTPGMIVAANTLLQHPEPLDDDALRQGLSGNLCRCTGYMRILAAVRAAAGRRTS